MQYIAFDLHKRYTFASVEVHATGKVFDKRIEHERGALTQFLSSCDSGSPVAVETIGNWFWIVDEIEAAGMHPQLVHARNAEMMLASSKKTDKLDAHGMNRLQRVGTLPTVWIPNGELRDRRELFRTRMVFTQRRTSIKNRIHPTLAKYGIRIEDTSDIFNNKGRAAIHHEAILLPEHTKFEQRISATYAESDEMRLLRTIPGIGAILAEVIASEVGDIGRFATPARLASYSGTTLRVHASGGKYRYGRAPADTNHYLKCAFSEAANSIMMVRHRIRYRHAAQLYERVKHRKGHSVAIGASTPAMLNAKPARDIIMLAWTAKI